jgi:protein-L-isoaspartate(D-aspartate) O-methyltransferase
MSGKAENGDAAPVRYRMVETQIAARGISDARVLTAMRKIPRHRFVPENVQRHAYDDEPLPIGYGQTISQPYIVAFMTEALALSGGERILEVGTGSGYQTAVLAEVAGIVWTVEIHAALSERAKAVLGELGYMNIRFRVGDGGEGWPENAPYDAIIVTAAPESVPRALRDQLADGGRLIIPLGSDSQELVLIGRTGGRFEETPLLPVRFVPLVGKR